MFFLNDVLFMIGNNLGTACYGSAPNMFLNFLSILKQKKALSASHPPRIWDAVKQRSVVSSAFHFFSLSKSCLQLFSRVQGTHRPLIREHTKMVGKNHGFDWFLRGNLRTKWDGVFWSLDFSRWPIPMIHATSEKNKHNHTQYKILVR